MYRMVNESLAGDYSGNTSVVLKIGTIPMYVTKLDKVMDVELKPIVQCVEKAMGKIMTRYKFMAEYIRYNRTMYVLTEPRAKGCRHQTMSVDTSGNLWLNVHFIYNDLNNDTNRVFGIIFHELMHRFLNHLERMNRILSMDGRKRLLDISPKLLQDEDLKMNLCTDLEVNLDMVADGVVSKDFWIEMHGMYDEKYMGKTFEEIYKKDGDKLLADYKRAMGSKMDEEYYKALKEIVKALKILHDPDSTDAEKARAAADLEDIINKLLGERRDEKKKTIRTTLQKMQKTRIKEVGEIGPYLKAVIDDLRVSPEIMSDSDLSVFLERVDMLSNEIASNAEGLTRYFDIDEYVFKDDVKDCFDTLKDGVKKMHNPDLSKEEYTDIEEEVILKIEKLLADDIKKKALDDEAKAKKEEKKKKKEEDAKKMLEKKKKKHLLYKYYKVFENLSYVYDHGRASEETANGCHEVMAMIEPLLEKEIEDITKDDFKDYREKFEALKKSLREDLQKLVDDKTIVGHDDAYIDRLVNEFFDFNTELCYVLGKREKLSQTELAGYIMNAIDSVRLIGKNLHTQKKYRPSDEYKAAYKEEYDRLVKIYKELGEKGLRRELGLPTREEMEDMKGDIDDEEDIKPYEGTVYYNIYYSESTGTDGTTVIELSNRPDIMPDDWETYEPISNKFEKDFPEYVLEEEMEATFSVYVKSEYEKSHYISPKLEDLKKIVSDHPDYKKCEWESYEE